MRELSMRFAGAAQKSWVKKEKAVVALGAGLMGTI
jgi:hypothetical protein